VVVEKKRGPGRPRKHPLPVLPLVKKEVKKEVGQARAPLVVVVARAVPPWAAA
jgi:hypothetical protein